MYFGYIGDIRMFAGVRTPKFWMLCQGQLLKIDDYPKLHKVLGTTYGGDGTTSFALPDFRGRLAVHIGTGPNLSPWAGGEKKGEAAVTLTADAIPPHTHTLYAVNREGDSAVPDGRLYGKTQGGKFLYQEYDADAAGRMASSAMTAGGVASGHENQMPGLGISFIICVNGVEPSPN